MIKRLSPKSHFSRNVLTLLTGTTIAQVIAALSLPILTRLYTPQDFNLLAIYMAILGLVTVISGLRLNIAIPLPDRDEVSINLLALCLISSFVIGLVLFGIVIAAPELIVAFLKQPDLAQYLWMIPVGVIFASTYDALQYWTSRRKQFALISRTQMIRATGGSGVQVIYGLGSYGAFGLIFGHMIYGGLGVIALFKRILQQDRKLVSYINLRMMRSTLSEYRRFPIYSIPEALLNTASTQVPILIIAATVIGPEAGFVLLAMRVMGLPLTLIGRSVAQVYLVDAPLHLRNGTLSNFTHKIIISLFKIGAPPLLFAGIAAPFLFPLIFGDNWTRAGVIVAWMTPWFILQFIASPISVALHVTNNIGSALLLQAFGAALRIGMVVGMIMINENWVVEAYALSGAAFYGIYTCLLYKVINTK